MIIKISLGLRDWDFKAGSSSGQRSFLVLQGIITEIVISEKVRNLHGEFRTYVSHNTLIFSGGRRQPECRRACDR